MMQFIDLKKQYSLMEKQILRRIKGVLEHGQYIMGPEIDELEQVLADFVGVKYCVGNSSGTDALLLALMALGIQPGDEVITTPFTFFAPVEMLLLLQAKPVFVDIDAATYNLNPDLLEAAITPKTKAILPVSLYGQCAPLQAINVIASKYHLPVIEDAAQSFGAKHHGRLSCGWTTIGCTSFFPSKPLGAYGDAGASFTNDKALADAMRSMRVHGQAGRYEHKLVGLNARMDTIQAAILLEKMHFFLKEMEQRQVVAERYHQLLKGMVKTPEILPENISAYAQYTIEVPNREIFQAKMQAKGIPTAVHYPGVMHQQPVFSGQKFGHFPVAEKVSQQVISLPMHPYLTESEQSQIAEAIAEVLEVSDVAMA